MKSIQFYEASKYKTPSYKKVSDGIYAHGEEYVTSLSFQQEPELGEGDNAADISQYPLEDILDKYRVYVSDFYRELNTKKSKKCFIEFAGTEVKNITNLRSIIGKHVYNRQIQEKGEELVELVIEPEKKTVSKSTPIEN